MTANIAIQQKSGSHDIFLGRQPIFDRARQVHAYELLFRCGQVNRAAVRDGVHASSQVIHNTLNVLGLATITRGKPAFINFGRDMLVDEVFRLLPADGVVIEVLEDVVADAPVIRACQAAKQAGYTLALDDVTEAGGAWPLMDLADVVKVDFQSTAPARRQALSARLTRHQVALLAEKVETLDDFQQAIDLGYDYAQGYFFCEPQIVLGRDIPGAKRSYLKFLRQVNDAEIDFNQLEDTVKQDLSLTTKLLRYLNSASFGLRSRVISIHQALVLLGQKQLQKWASVAAVTCVAVDKPGELIITCMTRARACERLAELAGMSDRRLDLFLVGLLSTMDALVDRPIDEVLMDMPLPTDAKLALLGGRSPLGCVYQLVVAAERGDFEAVTTLAAELGLKPRLVAETYHFAQRWADEIVH